MSEDRGFDPKIEDIPAMQGVLIGFMTTLFRAVGAGIKKSFFIFQDVCIETILYTAKITQVVNYYFIEYPHFHWNVEKIMVSRDRFSHIVL